MPPKPPKTFRGKKSKIKISGDGTKLIEKVQDLTRFVKNKSGQIMKEIMPDVIHIVARYTPPNIGKNTIEKRFYTRPILYLPDLVRGKIDGHKPNSDDYRQLRSGMKFKVLYTKRGMKRSQAFAYSKTMGQAKKLSKIKNRGISRIAWGKSLPTIGINVPKTVVRLMNKSPNLSSTKEFSKAQVSVIGDNDKIIYKITNRVQSIARYGSPAVNQGYKKMHNLYTKRMNEAINGKTKSKQ